MIAVEAVTVLPSRVEKSSALTLSEDTLMVETVRVEPNKVEKF